MPVTIVADKATHNIKQQPGVLQAIFIANAGTAWTLQVNDGPDAAGNFATLLGVTPFTVPAVGTNLLPQPLPFSRGLQVITAGSTAGELTFLWQ